MMRRQLILAAPALGCLITTGCSRNPGPTLVPPQTVEMNQETLGRFREGIQEYVEFRRSAHAGIAPVSSHATGEEISAYQRALAQAIVAQRPRKKRGNIFGRDVEAAMRRTFLREFSGSEGAVLIGAIEQGNPAFEGNPLPTDPRKESKVAVPLVVNSVYPSRAPVSNVPPSLLLKLPALPSELRYRFVGRSLILRDSEAGVILDFIADVVPAAPRKR